MPISAGMKAPDFSLSDDTGKIHNLADYRGQAFVLYFYPKDDTPGCTTEACNFRDDYSEYEKAGVKILGVSPDSPQKHAKFKAKFNLPFPLLSDPDHQVASLYDVWGPKKFMGRSFEGILRTTFIIGPQGEVVQVFENVKPAGHSQQILDVLNRLGSQA